MTTKIITEPWTSPYWENQWLLNCKRAESPDYCPPELRSSSNLRESSPDYCPVPEVDSHKHQKAIEACNREMIADIILGDIYDGIGAKKSRITYSNKSYWTNPITGDKIFYVTFIKSKTYEEIHAQLQVAVKDLMRNRRSTCLYKFTRFGVEYYIG